MKKTIRLLSFIIMIAVCVFVFSGCQGDDWITVTTAYAPRWTKAILLTSWKLTTRTGIWNLLHVTQLQRTWRQRAMI